MFMKKQVRLGSKDFYCKYFQVNCHSNTKHYVSNIQNKNIGLEKLYKIEGLKSKMPT